MKGQVPKQSAPPDDEPEPDPSRDTSKRFAAWSVIESPTQPRVSPANFVALALVINRLRDGPTFVFHYPAEVNHGRPRPGPAEPADAPDYGDIILERLSGAGLADTMGPPSMASPATKLQPWGRDEHPMTDGGIPEAPWESMAGFPTRDLATILSPSRPYHKRRFQLSLDSLYCVSYPIYVSENGKWKKQTQPDGSDNPTGPGDDGLRRAAEPDADKVGREAKLEAAATSAVRPEPPKPAAEEGEEKPSSMNMFNLVFVLNPKRHEVNSLVDNMYRNVVKKVTKVLKYSQEHSDFVWKESKRILAMKDGGREEGKQMDLLWREIVAMSSLAACIRDIYEAVSQNRIAMMQLDTPAVPVPPSIQIPISLVLSDLPDGEDQQRRGLWLSTANSFINKVAAEKPTILMTNFTLLLLDDEKNIVTELESDPDDGTREIIKLVRLCRPTVSFSKTLQDMVLPHPQVRRYVRHLIRWRRAIAVPPLHARDVYIVSPNCNMARLGQASAEWRQQFSHVPPLVNFLAELSYAPRPYKTAIPTKAHRALYLDMLAWLMLGGWVTQLCTYAYVIVWPEIVYEIEHLREAKEIQKGAAELEEARAEPSRAGGGRAGRAGAGSEYDAPHVPTEAELAAEQARLERIAEKAARDLAERAAAHGRKPAPVRTGHPATNAAPHLLAVPPHIILDPVMATEKESQFLQAITVRLSEQGLGHAWGTLVKYFNGKYALERVALQEDMSRKETWAQLSAISGYLLYVRHW